MLVGHFAAGMIAKRAEPRISLGTAVVAAMLADFVAFGLLIAGVEHFSPSTTIPYSHGLSTLAIWGAIFAGVYFFTRKISRAAWILFALVMSHWVLDTISHPPDMAIAPGLATRLGLGLWSSLPWTIAVEGGFWLIAIILYLRATSARKRAGTIGFWIPAALLTWLWIANIRAGTDPNPVRAGIGGFIVLGLFTAWAYWMNHARAVVVSSR
jgi:hypothetical protein